MTVNGLVVDVIQEQFRRAIDDSGAWRVEIVRGGKDIRICLSPAEKAAVKKALEAHVDPDLHQHITVF